MKTIAKLTGPEFLRACNRTRHAVAEFLAVTGVLDLRKVIPTIPENATEDEKNALYREQAKKNLSAMLDRALEEYPEETYKVLCSMMILEPGEEPDGFDLLTAALEIVSEPKMLDFFTRLTSSVQRTTAG